MTMATVLQSELELNEEFPAPTAAKTMAVIKALGQNAEGLTQAEAVKETECWANLVFRVLSTLEILGYVSRHVASRRYVLIGWLMESCQPRSMEKSLVLCAHAAMQWAHAAMQWAHAAMQWAHAAMQWLRDQSRETVQLMIRAGNKEFVLEQVSGLEPVQVMGRVGTQIPLYSCAPGKAILAALTDAELDEWLAASELKSFNQNTKATRMELLNDLERSRRRGYTEDWEEGIEGIRCAAAPILDAYQRPVGAITVMSPATRLPRKRFSELGQWCIEAAARVRKELLW